MTDYDPTPAIVERLARLFEEANVKVTCTTASSDMKGGVRLSVMLRVDDRKKYGIAQSLPDDAERPLVDDTWELLVDRVEEWWAERAERQ